MADDTQASPRSTDQTLDGGWCDWHRGPSGTAAPVEGGSACAPCREQRDLAPLRQAVQP